MFSKFASGKAGLALGVLVAAVMFAGFTPSTARAEHDSLSISYGRQGRHSSWNVSYGYSSPSYQPAYRPVYYPSYTTQCVTYPTYPTYPVYYYPSYTTQCVTYPTYEYRPSCNPRAYYGHGW